MDDPKLLRRKAFVDSLISLDAIRYERWKYFEDRADKLGERLWSTGVWLMSLVGATLALPFVAEFITVKSTGYSMEAPIPVALIALFGCARLDAGVCYGLPACSRTARPS